MYMWSPLWYDEANDEQGDPMTTMLYLRRFEKMVRRIGFGYHPDTAGADYLTLPEQYTAEEVDLINEEMAEGTDFDIYAETVEIFDRMMLEREQ